MKMTTKIFTLFLMILLFSCDCQKMASGVVYDDQTKLPLANVQFNCSNGGDCKTNEKGEFKILKMDGRRCKIIKTYFKKEKYKTLKIKIKNRSENNAVYLKIKK